MPKMRLYGLPEQVEQTISLLYQVLIISSVSEHYPSGDPSNPGVVRVDVDYDLPEAGTA